MFQPSAAPPSGPAQRLITRPALQALAYLLLAIVVIGFGLVRLWDIFSLLPQDVSPPWWSFIAPFAVCGLVLFKRRAPLIGLVAAVVLFVVDLLSLGSIVTVLVLLEMLHSYTVTLTAEGRRRVLVWAVMSTAVITGAAYAASRDPQITVLIGLQFGALIGFSYWYANSIAQSRELVDLYRQRADDAARLAELDREAAVRGERERMARELHDVVAGHVAAVAIRSEAALSGGPGLPGGADGETDGTIRETTERSALRAVRDASLAAHGELRSMISVLREGEGAGRDDFVPSRGRDSVAALVEEANRSGLEAMFTDELEGGVATATDHAIGRIVQEALANAAKHSSGARVDVRLGGDVESVRLEVTSCGGVSLERLALTGNGIGLDLLAERASAVGGRLTAGLEPSDGTEHAWVVRAELPRGSVESGGVR